MAIPVSFDCRSEQALAGTTMSKKMSLDSSAFGVRMTVQRGGRDGAMFGAVFLPASSHVSFTQSLIGLYGSSAYDQG